VAVVQLLALVLEGLQESAHGLLGQVLGLALRLVVQIRQLVAQVRQLVAQVRQSGEVLAQAQGLAQVAESAEAEVLAQ
jgi:hypothetical protein